MNKNILVSEVPGGGGGCTVGISSPRTNVYDSFTNKSQRVTRSFSKIFRQSNLSEYTM